MCFKFGDDRFRGLASAEGQILPFPIDFDGRPYNTLTLLCDRVIIRQTTCDRNTALCTKVHRAVNRRIISERLLFSKFLKIFNAVRRYPNCTK